MDELSLLLSMADRMLWTTALVAAPILLAALGLGLVIGLIQAATSVNEQTLTFVPKLIVVGVSLIVFGGAILTLIGDFTISIFERIPDLVR